MTTMDVVRPRLKWFVKEMDRRLALPKNQAKGDWRDPEACSLESLVDHAASELEELRDELPFKEAVVPEDLTEKEAERIIREAADLSNMSMMIADRARHEAAKANRRGRSR
jgi:hypothetical protein